MVNGEDEDLDTFDTDPGHALARAYDLALNGMELGGGRLKVRKASIGITQVAGIEMGVNAMSMLAGTTSLNPDASRVVQLLNMVTAEELMDNDDYEGEFLLHLRPTWCKRC